MSKKNDQRIRTTQTIIQAITVPGVSSAAGVLIGTDAILSVAKGAQETVEQYPDAGVQVPLGSSANLLKKIISYVTPVFLIFGWADFFQTVSAVLDIKKNNKSVPVKNWLMVGNSFITALGTTLAVAFFLAGAIYLAPYIIGAVLGINILFGLYNTLDYLIKAYKNPTRRQLMLKEAGAAFLSTVVNALAFTLNILLFQAAQLISAGLKEYASSFVSIILHYDELMAFINGPVAASVLAIKGVGLAWFSLFALGVAVAFVKTNNETWEIGKNFIQNQKKKTSDIFPASSFEGMALKSIELFKNNLKQGTKASLAWRMLSALAIPTYIIAIAVHAMVIRPLAALVLGLPQLLCVGIYQGGKRLFSGKAKDNDFEAEANKYYGLDKEGGYEPDEQASLLRLSSAPSSVSVLEMEEDPEEAMRGKEDVAERVEVGSREFSICNNGLGLYGKKDAGDCSYEEQSRALYYGDSLAL